MPVIRGLTDGGFKNPCPKGVLDWDDDITWDFMDRGMAFDKNTGRVFKPKDEDPYHYHKYTFWLYIDGGTYPLFSATNEYLGYKFGGQIYDSTGKRTDI